MHCCELLKGAARGWYGLWPSVGTGRTKGRAGAAGTAGHRGGPVPAVPAPWRASRNKGRLVNGSLAAEGSAAGGADRPSLASLEGAAGGATPPRPFPEFPFYFNFFLNGSREVGELRLLPAYRLENAIIANNLTGIFFFFGKGGGVVYFLTILLNTPLSYGPRGTSRQVGHPAGVEGFRKRPD